jgi:ribosome-associated heat shock protein Hsp15
MSGKAAKVAGGADAAAFQRLDMWLWCARVAKARSDCARLVEEGALRLNRQPTQKAHAKLRVGDVLTMVLRGEVRVWRVLALAARRGPAAEARLLYEELPEAGGMLAERDTAGPCAKDGAAAYEGPDETPDSGNVEGGFQAPFRRIERDGPES